MIGIFDSGSGGLSVLAALRARVPQVDVVYFGDLANVPYGNKSVLELQELTARGFEFLRSKGVTNLVSACNSVSAAVVLPMLRDGFLRSDEIIEMVQPTVAAVLRLCPMRTERIMVIATPATITSELYQSAFKKAGVVVSGFACPNLALGVEMGDEKIVDAEILRIAHIALEQKPDMIILGCTHYPLVINRFRELFGEVGLDSVYFFDPATAVVDEIIARDWVKGGGKTSIFSSKKSDLFEMRVAKILQKR